MPWPYDTAKGYARENIRSGSAREPSNRCGPAGGSRELVLRFVAVIAATPEPEKTTAPQIPLHAPDSVLEDLADLARP